VVSWTRPEPPHTSQGGATFPEPLQLGQVLVSESGPRPWRIFPLPLQVGQVCGLPKCPEPLHFRALGRPGDGEAALGAGDGLAKAHLDLGVEVLAALGALGLLAPEDVLRAPGAAAAPSVEEVAEEVAEVEPLQIRHLAALTAAGLRLAVSPVGLGLLGVVAELGGVLAKVVVHLALLGIGENLEGSPHLLELLFGSFVARIDVRVELARQLAVRLLDLILAGASGDAEQLVEVLGHGVQAA
jgi:hypothetical protein